MIYHNIYNSWSWLADMPDGETDLFGCCHSREVREEAGIAMCILCWKKYFPLESLTVDSPYQKGQICIQSFASEYYLHLLEADPENIFL